MVYYFESYSIITKDGIKGDTPDIFVLEEGDLEDFMKAIDNNVYEEVCDAVSSDYPKGRNKPVIAYEFFKRVGSEQPEKIEVVTELIKRIIGTY